MENMLVTWEIQVVKYRLDKVFCLISYLQKSSLMLGTVLCMPTLLKLSKLELQTYGCQGQESSRPHAGPEKPNRLARANNCGNMHA